MKRIAIEETSKYVGKKVKVAGWVHSRRDHGKLIFIDLRDRSGLLQVVFTGKEANALRPEWVISVEGSINKRPKGMINKELPTGKVELRAEKLEILSKAKTPPFEITGDKKVNEENKRFKRID